MDNPKLDSNNAPEFILNEKNIRARISKKNNFPFKSFLFISENLGPTEVSDEFLLTRESITIIKLNNNSSLLKSNIIIPITSIKDAWVKVEDFHYWFNFEYADKDGKINLAKIRLEFNPDTNFDIGEERYYKYVDAFKEAGIEIRELEKDHRRIKKNWFRIRLVKNILMAIFVISMASGLVTCVLSLRDAFFTFWLIGMISILTSFFVSFISD